MNRLCKTAALLALPSLLAGCGGRDTLVHGPFLIGAERPAVHDGTCSPKGDIRSQDARGDWTACETEKVYSPSATADARSREGYVEGPVAAAATPAASLPRRARAASADPRSAW